MKKSVKYFTGLTVLFIIALVAVALTSSEYFAFKIKRVANYSAEKILYKGADKAIDEVFSTIDKAGGNSKSVFTSYRYLAAVARQEVMWQNFSPAFKDDRGKYWNVAYASFTAGPNYHWEYYTDDAPKKIYQPMIAARQNIIEAGKKYFSDPENLYNFTEAKFPKIKERFNESSYATKREVIDILTQVKNHKQGNYEGSKYVYEFLERRRKEGGKDLILVYQELANKIIIELKETV